MTALRPVETRNVVAVASEEYPSNRICAHPECRVEVDLRPDGTPTVHHGFSRSKIKSKSYFVSIEGGKPLPHAVGFCGSGTTLHHGDLEEQRARLVLEEGVWYWEDRIEINESKEGVKDGLAPGDYQFERGFRWERLGALVPQPGSQEGREKKRPRLKGEAKKNRTTISIRRPEGEDVETYDELLPHAQEAFQYALKSDKLPPPYITIIAGLHALIEAHPLPKKRKT